MQTDKESHIFKPNSKFEDVISLYNFDKELRLLLFDIIERIEIALRSKMIYHLSLEIDPWWFENVTIFKNPVTHSANLISIDRELQLAKEVFIIQHYLKYHSDTRRPPAWKTLEVVSFGTLSKFYSNLLPSIKSKDIIASEFGTVNHTFLTSWLQSIAQIRNICAHHGRLWNKNLPGRPKLLPKPPAPWLTFVPPVSDFFMIYIHLCCMKYLLNSISFNNDFSKKLSDILTKYPSVDKKALGIFNNWQDEPLWR